jgi:hypothetical protein
VITTSWPGLSDFHLKAKSGSQCRCISAAAGFAQPVSIGSSPACEGPVASKTQVFDWFGEIRARSSQKGVHRCET